MADYYDPYSYDQGQGDDSVLTNPYQTAGLTNTSPKGTPWNVDKSGKQYDQNGQLIGQLTPGAVSGPYTPPNGADPSNWSTLSNQIFGPQPGIPRAPAFSFDAFNAPSPFAAPSEQDVYAQDPGYKFRMGQGAQALQQSAAARGVLNTGGTLKDLLNYGQNAASQEYSNAYDRALGTYQTNFQDALNSWLANAGNALTTYNTNYNTQYQNPYLAAVGQYQQGTRNQGQLFDQQFKTATS